MFKTKENIELSFGGNEHNKFLFNQSNQSLQQDSIQHPFGSLGALLTGAHQQSIDNDSGIMSNQVLHTTSRFANELVNSSSMCSFLILCRDDSRLR